MSHSLILLLSLLLASTLPAATRHSTVVPPISIRHGSTMVSAPPHLSALLPAFKRWRWSAVRERVLQRRRGDKSVTPTRLETPA